METRSPSTPPVVDPDRGSDPRPASERLVLEHLGLARALAARYRGRGQPDEDLLQVAYLGLVSAARRYRVGAGAGFAAYAAPTITGELRRHFRDHGWDVRPPRRLQELRARVRTAEQAVDREPVPRELRERTIADHVGSTLSELRELRVAEEAYAALPLDGLVRPGTTVADTLADGTDDAARVDDLLSLADGWNLLPVRERRALHLRYWDDATQSDIARDLGISQMHVSRILSAALQRLQAFLLEDRPAAQSPRRAVSVVRGRNAGDVVPACPRTPSSSSASVSAAA